MTALYLERYMNFGLSREELQSDRPVIGIAQSGSDLSPCNRIHLELAKRTRDGIRDAGNRVQTMSELCPNTRLVLGGYSQGAAVIDVISAVPFPAVGFNAPLPPDAPEHVAAIAVFGNPSAKLGLPITSSPIWGPRSIDLCNAGDPICSNGEDVEAHRAYTGGPTSQAAGFVAGLL